jgi:hypothetical protein
MKYLALPVVLLLGACVTTGDSASSGRDHYARILSCADGHITSLIRPSGQQTSADKGDAIRLAIPEALSRCGDQVDAYVEVLVGKVKIKNNWSSVETSVRPAVRKQVVATAQSQILSFYGGE